MVLSLVALHRMYVGQSPLVMGGKSRSPGWEKLEKEWLHDFPQCAACGRTKDCVPHHIHPFHLFPHLELDKANLITFCPKCHITIGHSGNWEDWNANCVGAAAMLKSGIHLHGRPKMGVAYQGNKILRDDNEYTVQKWKIIVDFGSKLITFLSPIVVAVAAYYSYLSHQDARAIREGIENDRAAQFDSYDPRVPRTGVQEEPERQVRPSRPAVGVPAPAPRKQRELTAAEKKRIQEQMDDLLEQRRRTEDNRERQRLTDEYIRLKKILEGVTPIARLEEPRRGEVEERTDGPEI